MRVPRRERDLSCVRDRISVHVATTLWPRRPCLSESGRAGALPEVRGASDLEVPMYGTPRPVRLSDHLDAGWRGRPGAGGPASAPAVRRPPAGGGPSVLARRPGYPTSVTELVWGTGTPE